MHNRIKILRKSLNLSQREFGERIGVKQGSIAGYEIGNRTPLDAIISSICREFTVSEIWLRTGQGEMFSPASTNFDWIRELDQEDEFIRNMSEILKSYCRLNNSEKEVIKKCFSNSFSGFIR